MCLWWICTVYMHVCVVRDKHQRRTAGDLLNHSFYYLPSSFKKRSITGSGQDGDQQTSVIFLCVIHRAGVTGEQDHTKQDGNLGPHANPASDLTLER